MVVVGHGPMPPPGSGQSRWTDVVVVPGMVLLVGAPVVGTNVVPVAG